jgi:hypothetical protein
VNVNVSNHGGEPAFAHRDAFGFSSMGGRPEHAHTHAAHSVSHLSTTPPATTSNGFDDEGSGGGSPGGRL